MPQFWENDPLVEAPAAGAPQPILTVPDPDADRRRAVEAERIRLAQEAAARGSNAEQRADEKWRVEQEDREARGGVATTEGEKTAAFLATRVANSLQTLGNISGGDRPEVGATIARGVFGDWMGIANRLTSEDRQRVEAAQRDLLDAALTLGTGAAYTAEQLEGYQHSYFPQLGDSETTISDKKQRLQALLASARVKAGAAAPAIDKALASIETPQQAQDGTREPEMIGGVPRGTEVRLGPGGGGDGFDRRQFLIEEYGITPNQEAAITAFWNANLRNEGLSVEGVKSWYSKNGIPVPSDDAILATIDEAHKGAPFSGIDTTSAKSAWAARVAAHADEMAGVQGQEGVSDLAQHGVTAGLSDEAAGVGTAISGALTGDFGVVENYRLGNDAQDLMLDRARARTGAGGTAVELLGNAASLGAGAISAIPANARAAMGEAALAGAVPGFGYGEGAGQSVAGAALGAGSGAALGGAFYRLANRAPRAPSEGSQVIQAADDLNAAYGTNIRPIPADVAGVTTKRASGATAQMPLGAAPIINASRAVNDESGAARDAIARSVGTPQEIEAAGQQALSGAQKWMQQSRARVNTLYERARKLGGDIRVSLDNARQALDQHIADLQATPGGAKGLEDLKALRDELGEDYTVEGIKRMRTQLRDRYATDGLRGSDIERRAMQIVDAAEEDIAAGLNAAGRPEAADAYRAAAAAHRERVQVIDNVMAPIIGRKADAPKSGEQIMQAITRSSKGDNAKLARFLDALPPEEAGTVRATLISQLGRANKGQQDATGEAFSLGTFLTNWNDMTPGARRTLFGGELSDALGKLAKVAEGSKEAQRFVNNSNMGSVVGLTATGIGLAGFTSAPVLTTAAIASQYGLGRLLASPRFARWLARMPKNPQAAKKHIEGLSKIAAAEGAIAADALGLQRQLSAAFLSEPARLAAEPVPAPADQPGRSEAATQTRPASR